MAQAGRRLAAVAGHAPTVDHGLVLDPFLGKKGTRVSVSGSIKGWPPQKYLNVTGSAWRKSSPIFIRFHKA